MIRGALWVLLSFATVASAQEEPFAAVLAHARSEDARTEYASAVVLYEAYANGCLGQPTAVLQPGQPCADLAAALERSFELARALGDLASAERIAALYVQHLLYAEPRAAMRVGYDLARMHLEAGRLERADAALARWIELTPNPPVGHAILVDAMRARIATAVGRTTRASMHWRRVERRYANDRDQLADDGAVSIDLVHEAVAEGRLIRAQQYVMRFLATEHPRARGVSDEQLWQRVVSPWHQRTQRRLILARLELERVYEMGSPRHSIVAAALIGEMYAHLASLDASLDLLPLTDYQLAELRRGEPVMGYSQAREHLETCMTWSNHHGLLPQWARRCEASLHALDPDRFPLPSELHGTASYRPISLAVPPSIDRR